MYGQGVRDGIGCLGIYKTNIRQEMINVIISAKIIIHLANATSYMRDAR